MLNDKQTKGIVDMTDKLTSGKEHSGVRVKFVDLGGQDVFFPIHNLYMTPYNVYVVVFSLDEWMVKSTSEHARERLTLWLNTLAVHTTEEDCVARIMIVGTHADKQGQRKELHTVNEQIADILRLLKIKVVVNDKGVRQQSLCV